ncbi:MAG TPA: hypothetical protein VF641_09980 [Methylobacterium sp.]
MTDNTVRDNEPPAMATWLMRARPEATPPAARNVEPFVALKMAPRGPMQDEPHKPADERNWSSALDLIHEATAAIRISEERSSDLEQELERVLAQAQERARLLEVQVAVAERRTEKAEERVRAAEKRANEAEAWLARLHDAIVAGFSRPAAMRAAEEAYEARESAGAAQASES